MSQSVFQMHSLADSQVRCPVQVYKYFHVLGDDSVDEQRTEITGDHDSFVTYNILVRFVACTTGIGVRELNDNSAGPKRWVIASLVNHYKVYAGYGYELTGFE